MRNLKLLIILVVVYSCSSDDNVNPDCPNSVIIDNELFKSVENGYYEIDNAKIQDNCLELVIASGGCDGNSWEVELIDADRISESGIVQRDLKILIKNTELCNAIIRRTFSFDIKPLQTNDNEIRINLENWENQLSYQY